MIISYFNKNIHLMKNCVFLFILCTISFVGFSQEDRCKKITKNSFSNIIYDKFISVVNKDTIKLNEVKYECVNTAMYTKKIMFDKFGKWHKEIYPNKERHPMLIWENIQLFPNDSTKFTIATNGLESSKTIYASILVFDKDNNDLLAENSVYRDKLVTLFGQFIVQEDPKKEDFYEVYWNQVDPKIWKELQRYKKNKK